ncbi:hypothetical protein ACHQM5_013107 [Ranunculus cassubicifolius]
MLKYLFTKSYIRCMQRRFIARPPATTFVEESLRSRRPPKKPRVGQGRPPEINAEPTTEAVQERYSDIKKAGVDSQESLHIVES